MEKTNEYKTLQFLKDHLDYVSSRNKFFDDPILIEHIEKTKEIVEELEAEIYDTELTLFEQGYAQGRTDAYEVARRELYGE